MLKWIPFLVLLSLVACRASAATATVIPTAEPTPTEEPNAWHEYELGGVYLGLNTPYGWETYTTESLVILAEHSGSIDRGDELRGMIVHIFIHPMDNFNIPSDSETNIAWAVLEQIIKKPDYVGQAVVTEPNGFDWDGHDAAYYLVNHEQNSALLIALALPDLRKLLVCSFSAPKADTSRIRLMVPRLLEGFALNGIPMSVSALEALPDPLIFPD